MSGRAERRARPAFWFAAFALPALAVLIGLGVWQLERRAWKHELIAHLEMRLAADPVPLPGAGDDLTAFDFRRARLSGRFLHDREQLLVGRSYQGLSGYEVMTPFALADGRAVFVDRGWIPLAARDSARGEPSAEVSFEGVIRVPPAPSGPGASRGNEHYRLNLGHMAAEAGVDPGRLVPVYVVATGEPSAGVLPVPRRVAVELPDNHLQYALTWFSLAAVLVVISIAMVRRR